MLTHLRCAGRQTSIARANSVSLGAAILHFSSAEREGGMKALGSFVCILGLSLGAVACDRGSHQDETAMERTPGATGTSGYADTDARGTSGEIRVADLMDEPTKYLGKTVTVVADLEEVYGTHAFALDEDAPFAGGIDQDILVISRDAGRLTDIDDQWLNNKVRVTGEVGVVSIVEVERELGWDLDPEIEAELEHAGAVILADSVHRVSD